MVSPKKTEYFKVLSNKNFCGRINLTNYSRNIIRNLFIGLIDSEITCENKKRKLTSAPEFSNYESYEIIKGRFKSFIMKEDVYLFKFLINFSF
jgi:hypothetical protein